MWKMRTFSPVNFYKGKVIATRQKPKHGENILFTANRVEVKASTCMLV